MSFIHQESLHEKSLTQISKGVSSFQWAQKFQAHIIVQKEKNNTRLSKVSKPSIQTDHTHIHIHTEYKRLSSVFPNTVTQERMAPWYYITKSKKAVAWQQISNKSWTQRHESEHLDYSDLNNITYELSTPQPTSSRPCQSCWYFILFSLSLLLKNSKNLECLFFLMSGLEPFASDSPDVFVTSM